MKWTEYKWVNSIMFSNNARIGSFTSIYLHKNWEKAFHKTTQ